MSEGPQDTPAEALFEFDRRVRRVSLRHKHRRAVRALDAFGNLGDQPPLRLISAGVFALGLLRCDGRMMQAGARMLLAHELATVAKSAVKHRIDRTRPRSAQGAEGHKPTPGNDRRKEETSFPSGHAAGSMAVALAFSAEYPQYRPLAVATSGIIGFSRVPSCAHYPSDVIAGWAIGAAAEAVTGLLWRMIIPGRR